MGANPALGQNCIFLFFFSFIMENIYIALFQLISSKRLTLIITPIDQVSIENHHNFLGSIQSGCLFGAQGLAIRQYRTRSDIGYRFTAGWTGEVLTRFEPGNFGMASEWSHHCATAIPPVIHSCYSVIARCLLTPI